MATKSNRNTSNAATGRAGKRTAQNNATETHKAPEGAAQGSATGTALAAPGGEVTGTVVQPARLPGQLKLVKEITAKLRKDVEHAAHNTATLVVKLVGEVASSVWDSMRSAAIALCKDTEGLSAKDNATQKAAIFDLYWAHTKAELDAKGLKMPSTEAQYGGTLKMALRNGVPIGATTGRKALMEAIEAKRLASPDTFVGGKGRAKGTGANGQLTAEQTVEAQRVKLIRESTNDVHKGAREAFVAPDVKPDDAKKAAKYAEEVMRRAMLAAKGGVLIAFWKALDKSSAQVLETLGVDEDADAKPTGAAQSDGQDARKVA